VIAEFVVKVDMDVQTLLQLDNDLKDFVNGILGSLRRKG
jgi:hypothetical protein